MGRKEEAKNVATNIVAATLITTAAITGTVSAATNNDAGLISASVVGIAGGIVNNKERK